MCIRDRRILIEHRDLLDKLAGVLLVTETIDGTDLEAYATGTKPIPNPASIPPNGKVKTHAPSPVPEQATTSAATPAMPPAPPMPTVD